MLELIFKNSGRTLSDVLSDDDRFTDLYASALYSKAKSCSLSDEVILEELENVICYGTQAMCVDEETWYKLFGNLLGTISEYDNVVDYYYPLASFIHKYDCSLIHKPLFFDENRITCDRIEELYNVKNPSIDIVPYVKELVYATSDNEMINKFNMIINSGVNVENALYELENVYYFSSVPTDLSEELWNSLFSTLMNTVDEDEKVCTIYYDLACYVHSLFCDLGHIRNEYGKTECVEQSLVLKK